MGLGFRVLWVQGLGFYGLLLIFFAARLGHS